MSSEPRELPQRRVAEVWSWLPAFRAVAEREHVQRAARELHVTASSLSRAIHLIEEQLGRRLFDRVGRNIRLNQNGRELLAAVRDAMRRVDDGIARSTGTTFVGEIRVACEGDHPLELVWRACARLVRAHPELAASVEEVPARRELTGRLLRGEIDLAVVTSPPADSRLVVERVADVTYGIYCGRQHPLHGKRTADLATIAKHPFVAPSAAAVDDGPTDQWPRDQPRVVSLRLPALAAAVAACEAGAHLAVIPDAVATPSLFRLPSDAIPPSSLYAVHRVVLGDQPGKATALLAELRAGAVTPRPARPPKRAGRRQA